MQNAIEADGWAPVGPPPPVPPTADLTDADLRAHLGAFEAQARVEQARDEERAETERLYWEHREVGHNVDVVPGCPICDDLVDECERIAAGGKCP